MIQTGAKHSGEYTLSVYRRGILVAEANTKNLITDAGMDYLGTTAYDNICVVAHVGTGTAAPTYADTALSGPLAGSAGRRGSPSSLNQWFDNTSEPVPRVRWIHTYTWQYPQGQVVGNLSEVGVGPGSVSSPQNLFSRALILDSLGNPTTVTATADDIVVVQYKLIVDWTASSSGTITVGGVDYDYETILEGGSVGRSAPGTAYGIAYGQYLTTMAPWSGPGHSYSWSGVNSLTSETYAPYTPGNHYRDVTVSFPAGTVSTGYQGVRLVQNITQRGNPWWIRFSSQIPVSSVQVFQVTQRASWART